MMKMRWGLWERAWSSSQREDGLGAQEGAYLEGVPLEWRVEAVSEVGPRGPPRLCGVGQEEEEEAPAVKGAEEEACLCGEQLPRSRGDILTLNCNIDFKTRTRI